MAGILRITAEAAQFDLYVFIDYRFSARYVFMEYRVTVTALLRSTSLWPGRRRKRAANPEELATNPEE